MKVLVMGASGATGRQLVEQLLLMGHQVKAIARSPQKLPETWRNNRDVSIIEASISEMSKDEMATHLSDCDAAASCLGHNLTFKGIYGKPRKLVRDAVALVCRAIKDRSPQQPLKFVLMNTTGNSNRDLNEPLSFGHRAIVALLRILLPPQPDNEQAADYLRVNIGQDDSAVEWVAVRPDSLVDEPKVSSYTLHPSPTRSALFDPGKTSRINVGNFMARLVSDEGLWNQWSGQMPVIYNVETPQK